MTYPCPCCNNLTLTEPPPGTYEVCPVCYWEDDPVQANDPDYTGGANKMSLTAAKKSYLICEAIAEQFASIVRKPLPNEVP